MSKGKKNGFIQKITKTAKTLKNAIKFFASALGTLAGWLIMIIFIVILFVVIIDVVAEKIENWKGKTNYTVQMQDLEIIESLYNSGYEAMVNAENFQDYKAFEYAVLMDAAEYIREMKQEKYDIHENQGEFLYEKELIIEELREEYEKLLKEWEEKYNMSGDAAVKLMEVNYTTNQDKLDKLQWKELLVKSKGVRNLKVEDYYDIDETGAIKGGNNRVAGPYLVYEFVTQSTYAENSGEINSSGDGSINQMLASGEVQGALEPYIYVVREDIEFSYFFDKYDNVIDIPLLFNANNADLTVGEELGREASRAVMGLAPVIFPDRPVNFDGIGNDGYTVVPYYTDETKQIIYKIPLETILGRYMPKSELLMAWSMLKKDVDVSVDGNEDDVVDELLLSMKGIYNEVCLLKESHSPVTVEVSGENEDRLENKVYKYSNALTNRGSFATFQKAGLELTKYDIAGFTQLSDDDKEEIVYATDFVSAILVSSEIKATYEYSLDGIQWMGPFTYNTTPGNLLGLTQVDYITASGTPEDGYSPPGTFKSTEKGYLYYGKESEVNTLKNKIEKEIKDKILGSLGFDSNATGQLPEISITISSEDELVQYCPVFKTETAKLAKKVKIWHTRMPVLLVDSAVTWARTINYTHTIEQNMFRQNNKKYIIPKSVSSIGLMDFTTSENSEYRGKAYNDIFSRMKEKDVVAMIIELEANGVEGGNDCYEFMRDTYKLIQLAKAYSSAHPDNSSFIHENTYNYVYIPDSIYLYDDSQTQKIYWLNLLTADQER